MEVRFSLTRDDYWSFMTYAYFHSPRFRVIGALLLLTFLVNLALPIFGDVSPEYYLVMFLLLCFAVTLGLLLRRRLAGRAAHMSGGEHTISIDPAGFSVKTDLNDSKILWKAVRGMVRDKRNFYFLLQHASTWATVAQIIPLHAFANLDDALAFSRQARQYWMDARSRPGTAVAEAAQ